jgi:hypothetical protein
LLECAHLPLRAFVVCARAVTLSTSADHSNPRQGVVTVTQPVVAAPKAEER